MESKLSLRDFSIAITLVVICGFFALASPQFLSARNLSLLLTELAITGTLALGMLLIILPGHIDLSAGSGIGLLGGVASVLVFEHHLPAGLAMLVSLMLGILVWFLMGRLIVRERLPSFIVTLGGLLIFKGLFWLVIHNSTVPVSVGGLPNLYAKLTTFYLPGYLGYVLAAGIVGTLVLVRVKAYQRSKLAGQSTQDPELVFLKLFITAQLLFLFVFITNQYRGIPLPALILGLVTLGVYTLTTHTPFGRYLYAIGGNEEAAVVSGIPVGRVVVAGFTIMGGIVAITGLMQTSYAGASTTTIGELMELDAVAACVIGGVSLKGGRGTVLGVLSGALVMVCLLNGMTLLTVPPEFKFITRGLVLSLAVWMDARLAR